MNSKPILRLALMCLIAISVVFLPRLVSAQPTSFSIESVGSTIGLGNADLKETTLNILRWVLGIMTLVAVAMIIFSGFIAATSSDAEKGERARRVIVGAVIGLVIILLAWAIVFFVARTTSNVTTNT